MLADGVQRRSSGHLDPSRRCANELLTRTGDQRGPRVKDGEQLLGNRLTGDDGVGRDSGDGVADLAEQKLGEVLGAWAERARRSWQTMLRRGGETPEAQCSALRGGLRGATS